MLQEGQQPSQQMQQKPKQEQQRWAFQRQHYLNSDGMGLVDACLM